MYAKKSNRSLPSFDFSGIRKIIILLVIGVICYFVYKEFVDQTKMLKQQVEGKNAFKKGAPTPPEGYKNLVKDEIKKIPSPSPR